MNSNLSSALPFCRSRASGKSAFTLIELLIVIAIIAILSIVVVLTLSPAEMLRQGRDATRLSDLDTINRAIGLYVTDMATQGGMLNFGNASTVYVSLIDSSSTCGSLGLSALPAGYVYHCASATSSRNTDGNGWLPVPIKNVTTGSPLGSLPIDPTNQSSTGLYYIYQTNGNQYELTSFFESQKYAKSMASGGTDPALYAIGSTLSLPELGRGLVGYWPMDEGSGAVAYDMSGWGNNGVWNGIYAQGKLGLAGTFNGISSAVTSTVNGIATAAGAANTISFWMNYSTLNQVVLDLGSFNYFLYTGSCAGINNSGSVYGTVPPAANQWIYVTLVLYNGTYGSNGSAMYYNGSLVPPTCMGSAPAAANITFIVGKYVSNTFYFSGLLDDIRIYNRALSASEIQALYNAEK